VYKLRGIAASGDTERILSEEEIFEWNKTHATARNLSDYFNGYILSRYAREYDKGKLIREFGYAIFKKESDTGIRLFPELQGSGPIEETHWTGYKREGNKVYHYAGPYSYPYTRTTTTVAVDLLKASRESWFETEDYQLKIKVKK
jgi:hypothetical protein